MNKEPRFTRHLRRASNIKGRDPNKSTSKQKSDSEETEAIKEAHETLKSNYI